MTLRVYVGMMRVQARTQKPSGYEPATLKNQTFLEIGGL